MYMFMLKNVVSQRSSTNHFDNVINLIPSQQTESGVGLPAHDITTDLRVHECFIGCAKELLLSGKKLSELCEHNADVSKKYGKHNVSII